MAKMVFDEFCSWPYHTPYGMVAAPKPKRTPRKRRPRIVKPKFVRKKAKPDGTTRKRRPKQQPEFVVETPAPHWQTPLLEATPQGFAEAFVRGAFGLIPDVNVDEWIAHFNPEK